MKKYILFFIALGLLSSCSDYLDVKPKSIIDKDVLIQTPEGFMEALNGVYIRCTDGGLYGGELTFGFPDILAQNYTITGSNPYQQTMSFNYKDAYFVQRKDAVWAGLYNAISYCNLILTNIDEKKSLFSPDIYNLIKGEALGLRAYLHLDAYRLFGNSIQSNPKAKNVPYITTYSNKVTPQSTAEEVLNFAIQDLTDATLLLSGSDPIIGGGYVVGYTTDGSDNDALPDDGSNEEASGVLFLQNRRHRMNYFAVCGTLARAYLCLGNKPLALQYALEVINSNKFPWTLPEDIAAADDKDKDRVFYKELVFGWNIEGKSDALNTRFEQGLGSTAQYLTNSLGSSIYEVAGVGAEDWRFKAWLKPQNIGYEVFSLVKYHYLKDEVNKHYLMAPAIRLTEMYYIAAECSFQSDPEQAWRYFNTVRLHRGIGTEIHDNASADEFTDELVKEYRKEFFGESQLFYLYKRLDRSIKGQSGNDISTDSKIFVLPLPDVEIEFGGRG